MSELTRLTLSLAIVVLMMVGFVRTSLWQIEGALGAFSDCPVPYFLGISPSWELTHPLTRVDGGVRSHSFPVEENCSSQRQVAP